MPITDRGIVDELSHHSFADTIERVTMLLGQAGIRLFASIDHSGEAAKAGFTMRPTLLLIAGSPKAGTPLMLTAPTTAIDLPLKILVHEDDEGRVWVSSNAPAYLQERHGLPDALLANIAGLGGLLKRAAQ